MICFCHMIKTAGLTLHNIFRNNYGFNYVRTEKENFTSDDLNTLLRLNRNIMALSGESLRSLTKLESACPNLKYITFLRDPMERYISHYNYGRLRNFHKLSFEERVKIQGEMDYQTKFILGAQNRKEMDFKAGLKEIEKAKRILLNDFSFVGLVERFDESLILMKKILNLRNFDLRYQRMNITPKKIITKDNISNHLMKELKKANKVDYDLYQFVKEELFKKQENKYVGNIIEEINSFKICNNNYTFKRSKIFSSRIGQYLVYEPAIKIKLFQKLLNLLVLS